jgi:hypothetical protein
MAREVLIRALVSLDLRSGWDARMFAYLHDENCDGPGEARKSYATALDRGETVYVHLCSGQIVEVRPATAVRITDHALEVLKRDEVLATFPRENVYFASDEKMEPPSLE